jgi:hypothetical protein
MKSDSECCAGGDCRGAVLYRVFAGVLHIAVWGGDLMGEENVPREGPAVDVSNHARALGPIAVTCSLANRGLSAACSSRRKPRRT